MSDVKRLAGLLVLASVFSAHADLPSPERACRADADCVISTFKSCCGGCCDIDPYATTPKELEARERHCAVVDCAAPDCSTVKCRSPEPAEHFRAVCRRGACLAERVNAVAECRTDRDCTVSYPPVAANAPCRASPCGCCPSSEPVAMPVDKVRPTPTPMPTPLVRPAPRPPSTTSTPQPTFGLTPGTSGSGPRQPVPTAPNCSPCPGPRPARAECSEGRCVLGPRILEE